MKLDGVVLLAAVTSRSQAYAQALADAGMTPERVIIFEDSAAPRRPPTPESSTPADFGVFTPTLSEPLRETCGREGWQIIDVDAGDVNAPEVGRVVADAGAKLMVYSGYGGQLVGDGLLGLGAPILHCHSGWLPDYKGSTTVYYSWLEEGQCGVSAILLDSGIDTGRIVARNLYRPPPAGMDIDHIFDNAVRADTLVRVLHAFARDGALNAESADADAGNTFYVIHPVLKHIAMLSRGGNTKP